MAQVRTFARVDQGIAMEIVPPLPLDAGWKELLPTVGGDARKLFGYPAEVWVELTDMDPMPQANWTYRDGVFTDPLLIEVME